MLCFCGIGDFPTVASANCYLLVIQNYFATGAAFMSALVVLDQSVSLIIMMDVHLTIFNFSLFSDILHSCHAIGSEFQWEKHVLLVKTKPHCELLLGTRFPIVPLALHIKLSQEQQLAAAPSVECYVY